MDEKRIVHLHAVYFKADAVSNIALTCSRIEKEEGYESNLIADLFSDFKEIPTLASADYDKTSFLPRMMYLFSRFIRLDNKAKYIKEYLEAKKTYVPNKAKQLMENADIRIWYYGAFYTLFRYFHDGDILHFVGITPPYLSYFSEFSIYSKTMLQAILDLHPFVITDSKFIKESMVSLGFHAERIHVLPLFHRYSLPYTEHPHSQPHLLAWGRYAMNKAIPELVSMCNTAQLPIRIFGDNNQLKEFKHQYKQAVVNNTNNYATLSGKVDDFESELAKANIYICNSYHEGFNMPLIEAEAHSLPVLARRGTAMDELVRDGYNGYLFSDIDEVPELIEKIMCNYKRMSRNAWQHSQCFTYEIFKKRYLKILRDMETERHKR